MGTRRSSLRSHTNLNHRPISSFSMDRDTRALMLALIRGHTKNIRELAARCDVNSQDEDGNTALMTAILNMKANKSKVGLIRLLVGNDVNRKNKGGKTAVMLAAFERPDALRVLIEEFDADVTEVDNNNISVLMWAAAGRNRRLTMKLILTKLKQRLKSQKPKQKLSQKELEVYLNRADKKYGLTALMTVACKYNKSLKRCVTDLVDLNTKVATKNKAGKTALDLVGKESGKSYTKIRKYLIKADQAQAAQQLQLPSQDYPALPPDEVNDRRLLLGDGVTPVTVGIGSAALLLLGFIGYQLWKRATKRRCTEMDAEEPEGPDLV